VAVTVGRSSPDASNAYGLTPFVATRPLGTAALVAAKLRMATASTALAWVLVLVAVPVALRPLLSFVGLVSLVVPTVFPPSWLVAVPVALRPLVSLLAPLSFVVPAVLPPLALVAVGPSSPSPSPSPPSASPSSSPPPGPELPELWEVVIAFSWSSSANALDDQTSGAAIKTNSMVAIASPRLAAWCGSLSNSAACACKPMKARGAAPIPPRGLPADMSTSFALLSGHR